jgi:chromosome segregation protein
VTTTFAAAKLGLVGSRQLVLVQTLDIARLTAHPVRLIPETFVAVTGMGPVDSNESGKTSFLAAIALLLGDPEWRVAGNGAAAVASLLFEPVTAGISGASAATEGYIVGMFADPSDIAASACTVWMKISSGSPYIQVKQAPGILFAPGTDDRERHSNATRTFRSLPGDVWGGAEFAEKLYGRSPRVLAYVASRGQTRSRPSLLKLDAGTFTPEQIGEALIALTGRATLFERDEQDRQGLANKQAELKNHIDNDSIQTAREDEILRQVAARANLRTLTGSAYQLWNTGLARAVIDAYARAASATCLMGKASTNIAETKEQLDTLTFERNKLRDLTSLKKALEELSRKLNDAKDAHENAIRVESHLEAQLSIIEGQINTTRQKANGYDLTSHPSAAEAARQYERLAEQVGEAKSNLTKAKANLRDAEEARRHATLGQFGESGEVIRLLADHGIPAHSLIAAVRLDPKHRHEWEARLAPWREALVVPREHVARAMSLLTDKPGTILLSEPDPDSAPEPVGELPAGVVSSPAEAVAFLDGLTRQRRIDSPAIHVHAADIGLRILDGYPNPVVGLDDLIAHWERHMVLARQNVADCDDRLDHAEKLAELAKTDADRAQAAEQHASLTAQQKHLLPQITHHRQQVMPPAAEALEVTGTNHRLAQTALEHRTELLEQANAKLTKAQAEHASLTAAVEKYRTARRPDDTVLSAWGRGKDAALRQLRWPELTTHDDYDELVDAADPPLATDENPDIEGRDRGPLARGAHDKLVEAIASFKVYPDTGAPPPPAIGGAASRYVISRETEGSASAEQFVDTLSSIMEWLEDSTDRDNSADDDVAHARQQRRDTTEFVSLRCRELAQALAMTQDAISQRASSALDRISTALDELNRSSGGFGAKLDYVLEPPDAPDKKWVCQVVPRWRRNPGGTMLAYNNVTNTAQEKLFSIHLVLAALLAAPNPEGRVLILDELADSLGAEHRREVLDAIAGVARRHRITILATCQDAIMSEAAPHCGEILYFHYPSKSQALNRPTRMFGVDRTAGRVELTAEALLEGRKLG